MSSSATELVEEKIINERSKKVGKADGFFPFEIEHSVMCVYRHT